MVGCKSILALTLASVGPLSVGCIPFGDPEGPGASGNVSLGTAVDASAFQSLVVNAAPDAGKAFDPAHVQFPTASSTPAGETRWEPYVEALKDAKFPLAYQVSEVLGTTKQQHWRVFAWLSGDGSSDAQKSGEPFGTAVFDLDACGSFGGFCRVKEGVDIIIDKKAP
jgi:hypothetical protein